MLLTSPSLSRGQEKRISPWLLPPLSLPTTHTRVHALRFQAPRTPSSAPPPHIGRSCDTRESRCKNSLACARSSSGSERAHNNKDMFDRNRNSYVAVFGTCGLAAGGRRVKHRSVSQSVSVCVARGRQGIRTQGHHGVREK